MNKEVRQIIRETFNLALNQLNEGKLETTLSPEKAAEILKKGRDVPEMRALKYGKVEDSYLESVLSILANEYKQNPSQELAWAIALPFTFESEKLKAQALSVVNNLKKGKLPYNFQSKFFNDVYGKAWSILFSTENERTRKPMLLSILSKEYGESKIQPTMETFNELVQDSNISEDYKIIAFEHYLNKKDAAYISEKHPEIFPTPEDASAAINEFKNDPEVASLGKEAFTKNNVPASAWAKFNPEKPEALFAERGSSILAKIVTSFRSTIANAIRTSNITTSDVSLDAPIGGDENDSDTVGSKISGGAGESNPELQGMKSQTTYSDIASEKGIESGKYQKNLANVYKAFAGLVEFAKSLGIDPVVSTAAEDVYVNGMSYDEIASKYPTMYPDATAVRTAIKRYITFMTGKKMLPKTSEILKMNDVPDYTWVYDKEQDDEFQVPTLVAVKPTLFTKSGEHETAQKKKMKALGSIDTSKRGVWEEEVSDEEVEKIFEAIIKKLQ